MIQAKSDVEPAKWQITATTIRCETVDDFVTIMVDRDWSTRCAWYRRYKQKALDNPKQKFDKAIRAKIDKCAGSDCTYLTEYRDKLIQEERDSK